MYMNQLTFLVFFVYGLAFFGMGITMAIESGRSPALAQARVLRPLAAFGLIHGTHEWMESYLMQAEAFGTSLPGWMPWLRLGFLYASFTSLFLYGFGNQPLPGVIAAVRASLVEKKLAPAVVYELDSALNEWQNPYEKKAPKPSKGQGDVALFVGDETHYLWPGALDSALKLLAALEVDPVLIGVGRNNGYLASSLGLHETAQSLARATLDELKATGAKRLLVLSPGDYYTFSKLYEERLDIPWPEDVELLEVTTFLAEQLEMGILKLKQSTDETPYAYVDPTQAVRVPSRHDAPRKLVNSVFPTSGRELLWRRERAHPVGNTALQFTWPDIAEKLTDARLQDALQCGAKTLISDDPGTLHTLSEKADQFELRVQGLYELLASHLV